MHEIHAGLDGDRSCELSVVIPAFNEANRIKETLLSIREYLKDRTLNSEVIVVDDGSTDKTVEVVSHVCSQSPSFRLLCLARNEGKGFAVKKGIEASSGQYVLFLDADHSTPIEEWEKLRRCMDSTGSAIAIGSRYLRDSHIQRKQPFYRIFIGRVGNLLIRVLLLSSIRDTQCGFKLFESGAAKQVFSLQTVKRFGFDMETLVIAKAFGYTIVEVPVSWFNSRESRVRPIRDTIRTLKDLIHIRRNLVRGLYKKNVR